MAWVRGVGAYTKMGTPKPKTATRVKFFLRQDVSACGRKIVSKRERVKGDVRQQVHKADEKSRRKQGWVGGGGGGPGYTLTPMRFFL
jgi:hypothetical protein